MRKFIALIFLCVGCLEPYAPPASTGNLNALVVDGYVDSNGSASVRLSRTIPLDGKDAAPKESRATVTIESSDGEIFPLHEDSLGLYNATGLVTNYTSSYVLHIVTADNDEYRSDEVMIYPTSPIDSVYWTINGAQQLEIRVTSHEVHPDVPGYYLTNGIETYEYHAPRISQYINKNGNVVKRLAEEQVYACWRSIRTTNTVTTTKGLSDRVMSGVKVSVIDRASPKISVRYSILVRQRSVSEEEYNYQRQLKTITEQQGSLFAQIPGAVFSNVHSITNPGESVLGYFHGQEIREYRYFVGLHDHPLPDDFRLPQPDAGCQPEATCRTDQPVLGPTDCIPMAALSPESVITDVISTLASGIVSVFYVRTDCGDCRIKGGTTTKPSFW